MSVPSVCLVVLDGWGLAPDGPGQRRRARRHAGVRRAVGRAPAHHADRQGRGRRAAGGADGQLRGRPPQPRRGRDRAAGPGADRRRGRRRLAGGERDAARRAARRRARASDRPRLQRRRALVRGAPEGADPARRRVERAGPRDPRVHRRPRHVADLRRGLGRGRRGAVPRDRCGARGVGDRPLLRDGPRPALGPDRAGASTCCARAPPRTTRTAASRRSATRTSAARPTSSSPPRPSATRAGSGPATRSSRSTSAPTGCGRSRRSSARSPTATRRSPSTTRTGRSRSRSRRTARRSRSRAVISSAGRAQLHVAETEKYPHVTYFFNGGEEEPFDGEVRELAPSPRDVPTYDHKPEMSAREATEAFLRHWEEQDFAFAIINFANADMVGHTGVIEAAVQGGRDRRRVPRPRRRGGPRQGRRVHRHRRPRQRRRDARGGRLPRHRALAQPGAVRS